MPDHRLIPVLLCLYSLWKILMVVSSHPQHNRCNLTQTAAYCDHGELTSLPVGLPHSIVELQLNWNDIKTLQGDSLRYPSLNSLSLVSNGLREIASDTFQHTTSLEKLYLAKNNLHTDYLETSQAFKTLTTLKVLDLSENQLDEEMTASLLQNLTFLESLNLSGNVLRRLDEASFRDLHQLKELDLQRNTLFELDGAFAGNHKLQRLNLAFNCLPCLTDFHMTQLVVLNVSHNSIEWFISRQDLNDTFQLETLDLSDNKLLFFPFLPSRSRLQNLYLSHNSVKFYEHVAHNTTLLNSTNTVEFYNMKRQDSNVTAQLWDEGLHGDISSLKILDLSGNQVEYFPEGFMQKMPSLSVLQMQRNCLETLNLTSEQLCSRLYELDVSDNRLRQIVSDEGTVVALANLTYLNLSLNSLESLPCGLLSSLSRLRSVDLSYNNIDICFLEESEASSGGRSACVNWRKIVSLRKLYLNGCNLREIPSSAFTGMSLTHLELCSNPGLVVNESIQRLKRTLQHLGLGNTQIQDFDFSHFKSLHFLNISKNSLTHLPPSLLNLDVRVLDVRDNRLNTIPSSQADALAGKLHTIFLAGNPFNCCQIEWFWTFDTTKTINVAGRSDIECKDFYEETHTLVHFSSASCMTDNFESVYLYVLIFVFIVTVMGIFIIVLLTLKPKVLQKSIKNKKYLKPTSY